MSLPPISFASDVELRDAAFARKLQRRKQLLLRISLPVVIIAALLALKLLSAAGLAFVGNSSYHRANYSTAAARYANTQFVNIVQPWKAYYNEGTAHYAAGKFFTATQRLDVALEKVPKTPEDQPRGAEECAVRVNYSLALEGTADESLAVGDAVTAERYYTQALEMLADCADSGEGGQTAEDAQERQEEGQQESQDQQQPEGGEGDDPEDGDPEGGDEDSGGQEPEEQDPQEQELEERNQRANEFDDNEEGTPGMGDGSGQNW